MVTFVPLAFESKDYASEGGTDRPAEGRQYSVLRGRRQIKFRCSLSFSAK